MNTNVVHFEKENLRHLLKVFFMDFISRRKRILQSIIEWLERIQF